MNQSTKIQKKIISLRRIISSRFIFPSGKMVKVISERIPRGLPQGLASELKIKLQSLH